MLDFDNDDIPELIHNDGEFLHIYKYTGFQIKILENEIGDYWPYGSSRVKEYSYLPEDGLIIGDGWYGPESSWKYIWKYNKKTGNFDNKHCYVALLYDDLNNNGMHDRDEPVTEEGVDIAYFDFEKSISELEYKRVINYLDNDSIPISEIGTYNYSEIIDYLKELK